MALPGTIPNGPPNIILFLADDMVFSDLGRFGLEILSQTWTVKLPAWIETENKNQGIEFIGLR